MSVIFADTSALAKRYVAEVGTNWVRNLVRPGSGNVVLVSELTLVELAAALARRQREGSVSPVEFSRLRNIFLVHVEREYLLVHPTRPVLLAASRLVETYPLRTLDAIQLACALDCVRELQVRPTFVSADRTLLTIAVAEGFPTDDPNVHP